MQVEIILDVICAWSYMGYTRFTRAASRVQADGGDVEVSFLPFELAPGAPTDGVPLLTALEYSFGAQAARDTAKVAELAAQDGLELNYDRAIATGTFEAHRLLAQAGRQGLAEQMVERLFRAHFTDGLNIGDAATLERLADEIGVRWDDSGADELRAELERVRGSGVSGVPVFRFEGGPTLSGAQTEDTLLTAIRGSDPSR